MKFLKNIIPLLFLGGLIFATCTSEKAPPAEEEEDKTAELIQGHWELRTAYRNDKLTETLSGIYFDFVEGEKMRTNFNLSGEEKKTTYELKGKRILSGAGNGFQIEYIDANKLVLLTKMRGYSFKLDLDKKSENE